jgi:hypothetical protein
MEDAMTCDEHKGRVSAWFDGDLDEWAFENTFNHLKECSTCRGFMTRLPRAILLMRSLRPRELDSRELGGNRTFQAPASATTGRFSAPLAAAAAIMIILLTIAVERNLSGLDSDSYHHRVAAAEARRVGATR